MVRGLKVLIPVVFMFLLAFSVAADMEVVRKDVRKNVFPGTDALFEVVIKNTGSVKDTFVVNYDQLNFYPFSDVLDFLIANPSKLSLGPLEEGKINVSIRTLKKAPQKKNYKVKIWVNSQSNRELKEEVILFLNVLPSDDLISVEPLFERMVAPESNKVFRFNLKNNADVDLDATVYASSELFEGSQEVKLKAEDISQVEFIFDLDPGAEIREYTYRVNTYLDKDLVGTFSDEIFVTPSPNIKETRELKEGFLKSTLTITKKNVGNSPLNLETSVSVSFFEKLFHSFSPKPKSIEKSGEFYTVLWETTLGPGESYSIIVKKNYLSLFTFVLLFLIFAGLLVYWVFRPVAVKKKIVRRGDQIIVHIAVQNRSGFEIREVEVIDIVPHLLSPTEKYGTLEPKRIHTGINGKKIVWNIPHISPHEELLLSYENSQKLKIHGSIRFPAALVSYKTKKHKIVRLKSNSAVLERKILPVEHKKYFVEHKK